MGIFDGMKKIGKDVGNLGKDVANNLDWRKVTVMAGDISTGRWDFNGGMMTPEPGSGLVDCVNLYGEIERLNVQTEESVKDLQKTLGFTIAGGLILGPLGVVAGYFAGGSRKEVCVLVHLKDKRRFLCNMDARIYQQMLALSMM